MSAGSHLEPDEQINKQGIRAPTPVSKPPGTGLGTRPTATRLPRGNYAALEFIFFFVGGSPIGDFFLGGSRIGGLLSGGGFTGGFFGSCGGSLRGDLTSLIFELYQRVPTN